MNKTANKIKMADKLHIKMLPKLACKGIVSNKNVYYPYLAAGIFSVFTYFIFASILYNDIIKMMPKHWQHTESFTKNYSKHIWN